MQAGRELDKRDAAADLAMCERATPGPWFVRGRNGDFARLAEDVVVAAGHDDTQFISEARTALPYWIQRAQVAEEEIERLKVDNTRVVALAGAGYEKLIAVLRWYADKENYDLKEIRAGGFYAAVSPVSGDGGQRARELLQELGTE